MRVLVVEDEPRLAALLARGLREEGYAVDQVGDGTEAVWLASEFDFDAVVLDVMLPGLDGYEVCRRMRAAGRWAPVLMLTARTGVDDRVTGLDAGADDYLAKPFEFSELAARIRALIRRGASARPTVLRNGDIELDPAAHSVSLAGRAVELTAREFSLLEYLMRHVGQVQTRSSIGEHLYDFAHDGTSNVIDQYVGYLRRKLGPNAIETVRGVGYRMPEAPPHG